MKLRSAFAIVLAATALPWALAVTAPRRSHIRPQIPGADRNTPGRIFLEHADKLKKDPTDSFMVLVGDVVFTKGTMTMSCDSAHYYTESESMDAFGNVRMTQGDTLEILGDELNYNGYSEIAVLYGAPDAPVHMRNRDVHLTTDIFNYDLAVDFGYYDTGGTLSDPSNTLTSLKGEYVPATKEANFYDNVHLNSYSESDTLDIWSDTLFYNTGTRIAELYSPSTIKNWRGTIYTDHGVYDTDSDATVLFDRPVIITKDGQTLTADTVHYDRHRAFGQALGNMILTDSAHHVAIYGNYGYYDEAADSSFVTGRAMLAEYSGTDTLWLHGRYIQSFRNIESREIPADTVAGTPASTQTDTTHVAVVYPRVRFYRSDIQGVADSIRFTEADTMLRMYRSPVMWNLSRQVSGTRIDIKLNDSTIEQAYIPAEAFTAEHIEDEHYNQLSGKQMTADFENGEMRRLYIDGNVEIIMYPMENDSTYNKLVTAESSFLEAWFRNRNTERVKMWPQTTGTAIPLFLSKKSDYYLAKFKWFEPMRPTSRDNIFHIPAEMETAMGPLPPTEVPWTPLPLPERLIINIPDEEIPSATTEEPARENDEEQTSDSGEEPSEATPTLPEAVTTEDEE